MADGQTGQAREGGTLGVEDGTGLQRERERSTVTDDSPGVYIDTLSERNKGR